MNWISSLCTLYDANIYRAGDVEWWKGKELVLIPIGYDTMEANIEINIDKDGNFISARILEKDEAETLVPYPEIRTSGIKALPLFDSLAYVAGDLLDRVTFYFPDAKNEKEREKKRTKIQEAFQDYVTGLNNWCKSPYSHPKVVAIYNYVKKKTVAKDLIDHKIIQPDENGIISDKVKIQNTTLDKVFVRFRVFSDEYNTPELILNDKEKIYDSAVWLDKTVQRSFIDYYCSSIKEKDLCYMTGERMPIARTNPIKIRGKWDTKAKLISSNDSTNFTYRGRFKTKDEKTGYNEAAVIGFITSQKVHNALKWIIRRQGFSQDGVCIVAWESALNDMPNFYDSAAGILKDLSENREITDEIENSVELEEELFADNDKDVPETNYMTAAKFSAALNGYSTKLSNTSKMVVLALDSATPGRLALIYYKELESSRYLHNIRLWHESCCWKHSFVKDKKRIFYEGMASIQEIALAIYGTEQGDDNNRHLVLSKNSDNKAPMLVAAFERLRPCILDGTAVPWDMVRAAVLKASNPLAYKDERNYEKVLSVACSLVKRHYWDKKQRNEQEGVILGMELDKNNRDRSYLYGRLLAVAERIERSTYEKGETRTTNAERYMQAFSRSPFRTWTIIWNSLQPYMKQLNPSSREYFKNLIGEITELFIYEDRISNEPLDGKYLIGYDCQRNDFKRRNKDTSDISEESNENNEEGENDNEYSAE